MVVVRLFILSVVAIIAGNVVLFESQALAEQTSLNQQIVPLHCIFQTVNDGSNTIQYLTPATCGVIVAKKNNLPIPTKAQQNQAAATIKRQSSLIANGSQFGTAYVLQGNENVTYGPAATTDNKDKTDAQSKPSDKSWWRDGEHKILTVAGATLVASLITTLVIIFII